LMAKPLLTKIILTTYNKYRNEPGNEHRHCEMLET